MSFRDRRSQASRHGAEYCNLDGIEAFSVGSEYLLKRMVELDLRTGEHTTHVFEPDTQAQLPGKEE